MSFLKSRQLSTPPTTGMSAGQWLEARKKERNVEDTKKQTNKYDFLDGSSSEESFSASTFLKKSRQKENIPSKELIKQSSEPTRPQTSRGLADQRSSSMLTRGSTALSRFSQLEKDILARQNKPTVNVFSSSDMDLDISSDSEIKQDMLSLKKKDDGLLANQNLRASTEAISYQDESTSKTESILAKKKQNLSKKKAVTFAPKLVETRQPDSDASLYDFLSSQYSDASLDDVLPQPHIVMSLDDLLPAEEVESEDKPNILELHTVDELLSPIDSDNESEVSKYSSSDFVTSDDSNLFNVQSLEELVLEKPSTNSKLSELTPTKEKRKIAEIEKPEEDYSYSEDFTSVDEDDDTLKETESIAEELEEEIRTESASTISESIATEHEEDSSGGTSYTQNFDSLSASAVTSSLHQPTSRSYESAAVQTDPVEIGNILLEEKILPKFTESEQTFYKPTQVINNEALSVLSSYSPAVLAVQEMLKQQLAFTRDFITRSERLHLAAAETLIPDYQYASLEEARKIINMQRQRLKLPRKYPDES